MKLIPRRIRHYTHIKEHNWLNHILIIDFLKEAARTLSGGVLADIGCGIKPYETIFSPYTTKHIGIDRQDSPHGGDAVDIIGDAYATNLEDNSCDAVLLTEVLEHLEEPKTALVEISRILKPGGVLIGTVPFFWHLHEEPRDFYRYSEYGLAYLLKEGGFDDLDIRPLSGFIVTFSQLSIYYFRRLQRFPVLRFFNRIINWIWQYAAWMLNRVDKSTKFTNLYGFTAVNMKDHQDKDAHAVS